MGGGGGGGEEGKGEEVMRVMLTMFGFCVGLGMGRLIMCSW